MENRPVYFPFYILIAISIRIITQWMRYCQLRSLFLFFFFISTFNIERCLLLFQIANSHKKKPKKKKWKAFTNLILSTEKKSLWLFYPQKVGRLCFCFCCFFCWIFSLLLTELFLVLQNDKVLPFNLLLFYAHFSW